MPLYASSLASNHVAVDIFPRGNWRLATLGHVYCRSLGYWLKFATWHWILTINLMKLFLRRDTLRLRDGPLLIARNRCLAPGTKYPSRSQQLLCYVWWYLYYHLYSTDKFVSDFVQAWHDMLARRGPVTWVNIFTADQSLRVPILFDLSDEETGHDRKTFEQLRMWYCLMRAKRGLSEVFLPRKLIRVDKVGLCTYIEGAVRLGSRFRTLDFGRSGNSQVVNLEKWWEMSDSQRFQTKDIVTNAHEEGLEFVRTWDSLTVSMIILIPFVLSLAFAGAWIGVSVHHFDIDGQVATQTAFTVAAYIVTAGALIIALFAFLDSQTQSNP